MSYKIIYICGNGHSGSTLLDIIIGSPKNSFSSGELNFIARDSILDEYCSCGKKISNCTIWKEIYDSWNIKRKISLEEYKRLRSKFESNKFSYKTFWNKFWPSEEFKDYITTTKHLFDSIHEVTNATTIIDSSKSPSRVAVLQKSAELQVIHICRDFTGVLNSAKRSEKKNVKIGIEVDIHPRRSFKTLIDWIFTNLLCEIFTLGINCSKLKYKTFVKDPDKLRLLVPEFSESIKTKTFSADHMLAGNVIRLKKEIKINSSLGFKYGRLSNKQLYFARLVNTLFWFWK